MFNITKIVSLLYLLIIAAALVIYFIKPSNKSKSSVFIAAYLGIFFLTELLTTFLLPRHQPNHYVYAWSFLITGIVLTRFYSGIIKSKVMTVVFISAIIGYLLLFVSEQLWLHSTILKAEWIANCHFAFALGALITLWFAVQESNALSSKFLQKCLVALVVYHTIAIINISAIFSVKVILDKATYSYFSKLFEAINFIFVAYLSIQLILYRTKTAVV